MAFAVLLYMLCTPPPSFFAMKQHICSRRSICYGFAPEIEFNKNGAEIEKSIPAPLTYC